MPILGLVCIYLFYFHKADKTGAEAPMVVWITRHFLPRRLVPLGDSGFDVCESREVESDSLGCKAVCVYFCFLRFTVVAHRAI